MNILPPSIPPGRYIVAVSGGVDSMVLLDLLRKQRQLQLVVAHFDHGIRDDSVADAQFVADVANTLGLEYATERVELGSQASEADARKARYDFLRRAMLQYNANAIITAHHNDDVLETTIINIIRGTGWRGLASLRSSKGIVRPLLGVTKADILAYAQEHQLEWREDSTNKDLRYLRNNIRLQLLPRMAARDQTAVTSLRILSDNQQQLRTEVEQSVSLLLATLANSKKGEVGMKRLDLVRLPPTVCLEVLRAAAVQVSGSSLERPTLRRMRVFACCGRPGKQMEITKNLTMRVLADSIIVYNR
jgi:tRNA(Ile)-lysidine synthase